MGKIKDIKRYLKENLDSTRYEHTLNVCKTARKLARRHLKFESDLQEKEFLKKVSLAALLHDADKCSPPEQLRARLVNNNHPDHLTVIEFKEIWHAFCGALTATERFDIHDSDVLNAVRYHTTGRSGMSELEKIIYLADYIEPGRKFSGVDEIRKKSQQGIDAGCIAAIDHNLKYLRDNKTPSSSLTVEARKDLSGHDSK